MAEMHHSKPYQQGQVDSFCGIYALINAIRYTHGRRLPRLAGRDLFNKAIHCVSSQMDLSRLATDGIDTAPLIRLAKVFVAQLNSEHGTAFAVDRPFARQARMNIDALHAALSDAEVASTAYIVALEGKWNHWTVVRKIAPRSFILMDSDRLAHIALNHCTTGFGGKRGERIHVIQPKEIIRIRENR